MPTRPFQCCSQVSGAIQEAARRLVLSEQFLDAPTLGGVAGTGIVQEGGALAGWFLPREMEQALFVHGGSPLVRCEPLLVQRKTRRESTTRSAELSWDPSVAVDLGSEPGSGVGPVTVRSGRGDVEDFRGLVTGQAGKVA